jgi:hypothetical protein
MTGKCGGKEMNYKEIDLLILDVLGKDRPVEGLDSYNSVWAEETVTDSNRQSYISMGGRYTLTMLCLR